MPTRQELKDLCKKCNWIWAPKNGVNGYSVCGRGKYASASIFLPAAGCGYGASLSGVGSRGYYWSSAPGSDIYNGSWCLRFYSGGHYTSNGYDRYDGQSIRPVQGFAK